MKLEITCKLSVTNRFKLSTSHDSFKEQRRIFVVKGRITTKKDIHDDTGRPQIHYESIGRQHSCWLGEGEYLLDHSLTIARPQELHNSEFRTQLTAFRRLLISSTLLIMERTINLRQSKVGDLNH